MMNQAISVILVDSDDSYRERLRDNLSAMEAVEVIAEATSLKERQNLTSIDEADILMVELNPKADHNEVLGRVEKLKIYHPDVSVFFSSKEMSPDLIMAAMRAGAQEYLERPPKKEELERAIGRVRKQKSQTRRKADIAGKILSIFSKKGGLGATTISVNTAIALSALKNDNVALLDLDFYVGDVSSCLDLHSEYSILDACGDNGQVELGKLQSCLTHHSSGVYVLPEPADPVDADAVKPSHIEQILQHMRSMFPYVVVDTSHSFDSRTLVALGLSDLIILPVVANISSVRAAKKTLEVLRSIGHGGDKIAIVVNRASRSDDIRISEIEKALKFPIFWTLPNNYRVAIDAMNSGKPIVHGKNTANLGKSISQMAESITNWNHNSDFMAQE